ncbi:hypothetical protein KC345_g1151 [Hortaea werneckii]|nr:hypothetical protein KC345_g1151 [Hortaea werneckii]
MAPVHFSVEEEGFRHDFSDGVARQHSHDSLHWGTFPSGNLDTAAAAAIEAATKRRKVTRACDRCKSRKRRCTGQSPCPDCVRHKVKCTYLSPYTRGKAPEASTTLTPPETQHACNSNQPNPGIGDTTDATPAAPQDLGQLTGAMSSRAVSPEADVLATGHYLGPTSPFSFLRRASRRFGHLGTPHADEQDSEVDVSIFSYGDRRLPDLSTTAVRLPEQAEASALIKRYFEFAAPTYRFLHEPTIRHWYDRVSAIQKNPSQPCLLAPIQRAIVFLVMAIATLYSANAGDEVIPSTNEGNEEPWLAAERYYQAAHGIIIHETGPIKLESIQARLASLSYLLNTSRLNQAWFTFGTCFQLILTLGMHRKSPEDGSSHDFITQECHAARQVLDLVLEFVAEKHLFSAFWNTQYVTFNALSIAYVWIIQRKIGRLNDILPSFDLQELFDVAETVQMHLATVTRSNAPHLRYSIILGELQQEARRVLNTANTQLPKTPMQDSGQEDSAAMTDMSMTTLPGETPSDFSARFDFPLDPNLWLQLDSFPFSE